MNLEDIGFYTLENDRAKNVCLGSDLWRCELILTNKCNFKCPYCRGLKNFREDLSYNDAIETIKKWEDGNLRNIRFSGGEPTLWPGLLELVTFTNSNSSIKRIALSTNGYADIDIYKKLFEAGVNDFSISLDACCSSTGDIMSGGIKDSWKKVIENIKIISKWTYVTVGIVMNDTNIKEVNKIFKFAESLGVSDIRILSSAQWNNSDKFKNICPEQSILKSNPILNYRINNFNNGRNVRGLQIKDCPKCWLILDDMVIMNNKHYPCIIYMREHGNSIGMTKNKTIAEIRKDRYNFMLYHNSFEDLICKTNCLDVCVDYNNKVDYYNKAYS